MTIDDVIAKLKGIECGRKGTSCPDQIAIALEKIKKGDGTKFAVEKKGQEINFSEKAVADKSKR